MLDPSQQDCVNHFCCSIRKSNVSENYRSNRAEWGHVSACTLQRHSFISQKIQDQSELSRHETIKLAESAPAVSLKEMEDESKFCVYQAAPGKNLSDLTKILNDLNPALITIQGQKANPESCRVATDFKDEHQEHGKVLACKAGEGNHVMTMTTFGVIEHRCLNFEGKSMIAMSILGIDSGQRVLLVNCNEPIEPAKLLPYIEEILLREDPKGEQIHNLLIAGVDDFSAAQEAILKRYSMIRIGGHASRNFHLFHLEKGASSPGYEFKETFGASLENPRFLVRMGTSCSHPSTGPTDLTYAMPCFKAAAQGHLEG